MRSWHRLALAVLIAAGCGDNSTPDDPIEPGACDDSYLDYENFGQPFLLDWCTGCHSNAVPANMRQSAPADVNFNSIEGVRQFQARIAARSTGSMPTMPPAGGPTAEERALLAEWIACGAK